MRKYSKVLSSAISAAGAVVIISIHSIDKTYEWLSYILSTVGMLLIIHPMVVDIMRGCKEQGKHAWKERKDFRRNCILVLLLVAFICFLNFVYRKSKF
nr:hypothetical protein [uncultured Caproiciproducens sp.]